jgi:hypothetical protein
MFDLRKFVLQGLRDAIGKMESFRIKLNAAGWHDKGVLSVEDLAEIDAAVECETTPTATDEE